MDRDNPWVSRFGHLLKRSELKKALDQKPKAIENPYDFSVESLCANFRQNCSETFFPTEQCIEIAERIIGVAIAFAQKTYLGKKHFINQIYSEKIEFSEVKPIALTGYAGIGKSSLLRVIARAIGHADNVILDEFHPPFSISAPQMMTIQERVTLQKLMFSIAGVSKRTDDLLEITRKVVFQKAIPLIFVDEFQFLATSNIANTLIAKLLLGISYIGVPFAYAANLSMINKLIKRPEEEKQRILADVILMRPDHHASDCWKNTILYILMVAPDLFEINIEENSKRLFEMTAGRKRALVELMIESIRLVINKKLKVTMNIVEKAFNSSRYAIFKKDAEIIASQMITGKQTKARMDLWCPPEFNTFYTVENIKEFTESRNQEVAQQELYSATTPKEKEIIKQVEMALNGTQKSEKAKVIKMPTSKKEESLLESTLNFLKEI